MEIIAVIFSLICVYLTVKKNVWAWGTGLIGVSAYAYVFFQSKLYADFTLQFFFFVQGLYGWYNWVHNKDNVTKELKTAYLSIKEYLIYGFSMIISYIIIVYLLSTYTDSHLPYVDSFVSILSLFANWLLAKRKIENWILWIIADVVFIGLFIIKELYLSAGLYTIFLIMAIIGLIKWRKEFKNDIFNSMA